MLVRLGCSSHGLLQSTLGKEGGTLANLLLYPQRTPLGDLNMAPDPQLSLILPYIPRLWM